jgi:hypothetical protein
MLRYVVPETGIEPVRNFWFRGILSPLRLPISPLRQQGPQWRDSSIGVRVGQGRRKQPDSKLLAPQSDG